MIRSKCFWMATVFKRWLLMVPLALASLALNVRPAAASLVLAMELPEMTRSSDAIVVGKVLSTQSRLENGGRAILTEITFEVQEAWKGSFRESIRTISILQPGGVVGDIEMHVHGLPKFQVGEEAVLFLNWRLPLQPSLGFVLNGLGQGKRSLMRNADGRIMAGPPDRSAAVFQKPNGRWQQAAPEHALELDDLRSKVKLLLSVPR